MTELTLTHAQGLVATQPEDISELRAELAEHHAEHPQRAMLADLAIREAEAALQKLRSLGHSFFLARGEPAEQDEFPKMLYRDGGKTLTVESQGAERDALDDGWCVEQQPNEDPPAGGEPPAPSTSVLGGDLIAGQGLPPDGAAGAGAKSDRPEDIHSVTDDAQRANLGEAMAEVGEPPRAEPDQPATFTVDENLTPGQAGQALPDENR